MKELLLDLKAAVFRLKRERGSAAVDEEEELEAKNMQLVKKEELLKKDAELVKKDQELEIKQKQLEALEVKMKGMKNGCTSCCGFMSVLCWACSLPC
jgi:hypothetical protein